MSPAQEQLHEDLVGAFTVLLDPDVMTRLPRLQQGMPDGDLCQVSVKLRAPSYDDGSVDPCTYTRLGIQNIRGRLKLTLYEPKAAPGQRREVHARDEAAIQQLVKINPTEQLRKFLEHLLDDALKTW
jgi:hypothetical protein